MRCYRRFKLPKSNRSGTLREISGEEGRRPAVIDVKGREGGAAAPFVMRWLFEFGLVYCVAKFVRLMALFHPIIESSAKDDAESDDGPKPALVATPNWRDKRTG